MRIIISLVSWLWASACGILGPDLEVPNRVLLDPVPVQYPGWYQAAASCLAQPGDFDTIVWYIADEVVVDGIQKAGVLEFPNTITMRASAIRNRGSVKHEMVHHVRQVGDELHGTADLGRCS